MNKSDITRMVSKKTNFTVENSEIAVSAVLEAIAECMKSGERIQFHELGTFVPVTRSERVGRNPRTGEKMTIPAKRTYKFKLGSKVNSAIND